MSQKKKKKGGDAEQTGGRGRSVECEIETCIAPVCPRNVLIISRWGFGGGDIKILRTPKDHQLLYWTWGKNWLNLRRPLCVLFRLLLVHWSGRTAFSSSAPPHSHPLRTASSSPLNRNALPLLTLNQSSTHFEQTPLATC